MRSQRANALLALATGHTLDLVLRKEAFPTGEKKAPRPRYSQREVLRERRALNERLAPAWRKGHPELVNPVVHVGPKIEHDEADLAAIQKKAARKAARKARKWWSEAHTRPLGAKRAAQVERSFRNKDRRDKRRAKRLSKVSA